MEGRCTADAKLASGKGVGVCDAGGYGIEGGLTAGKGKGGKNGGGRKKLRWGGTGGGWR